MDNNENVPTEKDFARLTETTTERALRLLAERGIMDSAVLVAQLWLALDKTQQGAVVQVGGNEFGESLYRLVYSFRDAHKITGATENPHGQREW